MPNSSAELSYSIRPCKPDDLDAMREICIETSSLPLRDEKDRQLLLSMFCDPYIEFTTDCFVAVNAEDRPIGYILCGADTRSFFRTFRKNTMPKITRLGFKYSVMARGMCALHRLCVIFAPAHLHIDLTESARRKGIGTELIKTLKEYLASQGINRVQLTCGSKNTAAISFYKRNGFKTVFKGFGSCVMRAETK